MASPVDKAKSPSASPKGKEKSPSTSPRHSPAQSVGVATPLAGLVAGDAENPVPVQVDVSVSKIGCGYPCHVCPCHCVVRQLEAPLSWRMRRDERREKKRKKKTTRREETVPGDGVSSHNRLHVPGTRPTHIPMTRQTPTRRMALIKILPTPAPSHPPSTITSTRMGVVTTPTERASTCCPTTRRSRSG